MVVRTSLVTRFIWFGLALVGAMGCAGGESGGGKNTLAIRAANDLKNRERVLAAVQQYYEVFSARDWSAFAASFWPGATISTVWTPPGASSPELMLISVQQFIEKAPEGPGSKSIFEERMTSAEVRVQGHLAQVWAKYRATFGEPGDLAQWTGTDGFTLMLFEDQWKIVALAFGADS